HRDDRFGNLGAQLFDHRSGQHDASDWDAALGKRDNHAADADGELQHRAVISESGKSVHDRSEYLRGKLACSGRVVPQSRRLVPDVLLPHDNNDVSAGPMPSNDFRYDQRCLKSSSWRRNWTVRASVAELAVVKSGSFSVAAVVALRGG